MDGTYLWSNGSTNPSIDINESGIYWVTVTNGCGSSTDTISVNLNTAPEVNIGEDLTVCTSEPVRLDATGSNLSYEWSNGSTNSTIEVHENGLFWVTVENECGTSTDSINVVINAVPDIDLGENRIVCDTSSILLDAGGTGLTYLWNDGSISSGIEVSESGTFWVTATNDCGVSSDSIDLDLSVTPIANLGVDQTACEASSILLEASGADLTYLWNDGSKDSGIEVDESGTYWVTVQNNCGLSTDSININFSVPPTVNLGNDQTVCDTGSLVLDANGANLTYLWNDGSTDSTIEVNETGTYWVEVANICGTSTDSINVEFSNAPIIDLGDDRTLCDSTSLSLDVTINNGIYTWQDGSNQPALEVDQSGTYWVEVENSCGVAVDTIKLVFPELTNLVIPNVFTPNQDGINDFFVIDSRLIGSSLNVFHRSGIRIYESIDYQNDWDGNGLPSGSYFWTITTECGDNYNGSVTILY